MLTKRTHDGYVCFIQLWERKERMKPAVRTTSIRLDARLADKAAKALGVKSRTEAVHLALEEIVALGRFKELRQDSVAD